MGEEKMEGRKLQKKEKRERCLELITKKYKLGPPPKYIPVEV